MSHFGVLVLQDGTKSIDELLDPFDENIAVEPYISKTKNEIVEEARDRLARFEKTYYADYLADPESYEKSCGNQAHIDYVKNEFPKRLAMSDEELFKEETKYCNPFDGESGIDEDGNRWSTYNPRSKWDWYVVGGRCSGCLKTKDGKSVNSAQVGELDFSPRDEDRAAAIDFWERVVEGKEDGGEKPLTLYSPEFYVERYGTKENYAACKSAFSTWAVVTPNGEWHEKGEIGWFALSNETHEEAVDWELHFRERFIDAADPDWRVTIVDCHI